MFIVSGTEQVEDKPNPWVCQIERDKNVFLFSFKGDIYSLFPALFFGNRGIGIKTRSRLEGDAACMDGAPGWEYWYPLE
jgi:hypothetical protein